jgi:hypothetical protein
MSDIKRNTELNHSFIVYQEINTHSSFDALKTTWKNKLTQDVRGSGGDNPQVIFDGVYRTRQKVPFIYLGQEGKSTIIEASQPANKGKVEILLNFLDKQYYKYFCRKEVAQSGRWHLHAATTKGTNLDNNSTYKTLRGDALKSAILQDFMLELQACETRAKLLEKKEEIKTGDAYKIIAKSQDFKSRFSCSSQKKKTSSEDAFEAMVEAVDKTLTL